MKKDETVRRIKALLAELVEMGVVAIVGTAGNGEPVYTVRDRDALLALAGPEK
jgi:hypothetical protein